MKNLIAVTGASGFVGSALVDVLERRGRAVRSLVRRRVGEAKNSVEIGNIDGNTNWKVGLEGVECVIHCAGRAHVLNEKSVAPLEEFRKVNRDGTLNLAEQAVAAGVRRLVFLSSIGVMGIGTDGRPPFSESDTPKPMLDYAISKLEAEQGLQEIAGRTGLEVVIIRPPLVYGPAAPGNFGRLMRALTKGRPLPFRGIVDNRRSYIGIQNLADLIIVCADHPAAASQIFLASDGEDVSTTELLHRMADALGRSPRLFSVPVSLIKIGAAALGKKSLAQSLCGSLQIDSTKAGRVLGWHPPLGLSDGLRQAAKDY